MDLSAVSFADLFKGWVAMQIVPLLSELETDGYTLGIHLDPKQLPSNENGDDQREMRCSKTEPSLQRKQWPFDSSYFWSQPSMKKGPPHGGLGNSAQVASDSRARRAVMG